MTLGKATIIVGFILLSVCEISQSKGLCEFEKSFPHLGTERCYSRSLSQVTCAENKLPVIAEGSFNCSGYSHGAVCIFACNDGFYSSSSNQTTCERNRKQEGEWSDGNFTCTEIICDSDWLPAVPNGSFDCSGFSPGDICNFTCKDGFQPSASNQTLCEENSKGHGNWTDGTFTCTEIVCDDRELANVTEGYFNCSGYSLGDMCNLTCNDGFYPSSSNQTQCGYGLEDHGKWQSGNFTCTEIVCDERELANVTEGFFNCSGHSIGNICSLTCNEGFYPSASNQTQCGDGLEGQGKWKSGNFTCTEFLCGHAELPTVIGGTFNCSGYSVGDVCYLTCRNGFYSSERHNRTLCGEKGNGKRSWKLGGNYSCSECPVGFRYSFRGSCYKFIHEFVASRSSARLACESHSAHLIFIENETEMNFLLNYTQNGVYYWFGYNGKMNHSFWDDGSNITFEGLLSELSKNEEIPDCMVLTSQMGELAFKSEKELNYTCHDLVGYICEYDADEDLHPTLCPSDMTICNDDWLHYQWSWETEIPGLQLAFNNGNSVSDKPLQLNYDSHHLIYTSNSSWCSLRIRATEVCLNWTDWGNSSYAFSTVSLTWEDAADICKSYDAHLVFIDSEGELNFTRSSIALQRYSWISMTHTDEIGDWEWENVSYNGDYSSLAEPCPEIWSLNQHTEQQIYFFPCYSENPFTCEREYNT